MSSPRGGAILLAAGRSQRMRGVEKTLTLLGGLPVAAHSLRTFAACPAIDTIVIVSGPANHDSLVPLAAEHGAGKVAEVVPGGPRRQDSVACGLRALPPCDLVAVHDTARPFATRSIIENGLTLAHRHGAAVPALPLRDTVKESDDGRVVTRTLPRDRLWAVQTPQAFARDLLTRAHAAAAAAPDVSDDAMLVEALGVPVILYDGAAGNLKITTPEDLEIAEALLATRAETPAVRL